MMLSKIGLGGGCHWCTEAVFQSLKGVEKVAQGYIASTAPNETLSEAVIITFNEEIIPLQILIEVHLLTHKSTSNHSFRNKYRSAIYYFNELQKEKSNTVLKELQPDFPKKIITEVLPFVMFHSSREELLNYYLKDKNKPFCKTYIEPKLKLLLEQFSNFIVHTSKG
ncbi:peptide-methionine (S)-S-oxide reductase [Wenyingzhuangia sp. IMCC45574]